MNIVYGDMWAEVGNSDLILFTGNSTITKDGRLVMGRGAALEARQKFPGLDYRLGGKLSKVGLDGKAYGVLLLSPLFENPIGAFQVKYNFRDNANLDLIRLSCHILTMLAPSYSRIAMNYPGIGYGHLNESIVEPIVSSLPNNIFVYKKSE